MKSQYIYIFIGFLILILHIGCKNNNDIEISELVGYFIINHRGEENRPVPSFIIKTKGDTTYQQITRYTNGRAPENIELNRLEIYEERDIEECNVSAFSQFKNILYEYYKNNKVEPNYEHGTFEIKLVDNIDTLNFTLHWSEYTKSFFEELEKVAQQDQLQKSSDRFEFYKNMQQK